MAKLKASVLSDIEISEIHKTSLHILEKTGIVVHHDHLLDLLAQAGATVDAHAKRVRLPESLVMASIKQAGKQYILHGRDRGKTARFGYGDFVMMSSPGQYSWIDLDS
ncbi:MAG: trimethylamine methyltransferase family protein, partial [Pseudomonadales bacterium]|nr:trimethylamine methyltransferase family protein [Pseudomonadales bacterium]